MMIDNKKRDAVYDISGMFVEYNPNVQKNCYEVIGFLKGTEKEVLLGGYETKETAEKEVSSFYWAIVNQDHHYLLY